MLDESVSVAKRKKRKKRKIITFRGSQSAKKRSNISRNSCNISETSVINKEPTNISKSVNSITKDLAFTIESTPKFIRNNQSIHKSQNKPKNTSVLSSKSLKNVTNFPNHLSKSLNDNTPDIVNATNNKTKSIENSQRINESTKVLNSTSLVLSESEPTNIQKTSTVTKKETNVSGENALKTTEKSQIIDESMNISSNRHIVTRQRYRAMCKSEKQFNNGSKNSSILISQSSKEADQVLKNKFSISVNNETREDLDKSIKSISQRNNKPDKQFADESRNKSKLAEAVENMEDDAYKIALDSVTVATKMIMDMSNLQNDVVTDCGDPISNEVSEMYHTDPKIVSFFSVCPVLLIILILVELTRF